MVIWECVLCCEHDHIAVHKTVHEGMDVHKLVGVKEGWFDIYTSWDIGTVATNSANFGDEVSESESFNLHTIAYILTIHSVSLKITLAKYSETSGLNVKKVQYRMQTFKHGINFESVG